MDKIQELKNKFAIYKIVRNHFGYTKESLALFKYRLFEEPLVCPEYRKIIGDAPDLRKRVKIQDDASLEKMDEGWSSFKAYFNYFCIDNNVKYSNYRENKIKYKNQDYKLKKAIEDFYQTDGKNKVVYDFYNFKNKSKEELEKEIQRRLEDIGTKKMPKSSGLELVLSLNFADWFLCSTAESWSTCISLESNYHPVHWIEIPSFIGDKNRAIAYLTDGNKKTYQDITTDRFITRCWVLTVKYPTKDKNKHSSGFNFVGEYPGIQDIQKLIKNNLGFNNVDKYNYKFSSKYKIELLWHDIGNGNKFLGSNYFDSTKIRMFKNKPFSNYGFFDSTESGYHPHILDKGKIKHGYNQGFNFNRGLKNLMENKKKITMFYYNNGTLCEDEDFKEEVV